MTQSVLSCVPVSFENLLIMNNFPCTLPRCSSQWMDPSFLFCNHAQVSLLYCPFTHPVVQSPNPEITVIPLFDLNPTPKSYWILPKTHPKSVPPTSIITRTAEHATIISWLWAKPINWSSAFTCMHPPTSTTNVLSTQPGCSL